MLKLNPPSADFKALVFYLNTSHVKVKLYLFLRFLLTFDHLNTSHVKVKLCSIFIKIFVSYYLNTSHVKVKPESSNAVGILLQFKYISC